MTAISPESFLPPPYPSDGTHFYTNYPNSVSEIHQPAIHADCVSCKLPSRLLESRPPDPEMVDLIRWAFIEGQIDRQEAELALWGFRQNKLILDGNATPTATQRGYGFLMNP